MFWACCRAGSEDKEAVASGRREDNALIMPDLCSGGAGAAPFFKTFQGVVVPFDLDRDTSIILISDEASQSESAGLSMCMEAEPDALHNSFYLYS